MTTTTKPNPVLARPRRAPAVLEVKLTGERAAAVRDARQLDRARRDQAEMLADLTEALDAWEESTEEPAELERIETIRRRWGIK